jgi:hypothetical protein
MYLMEMSKHTNQNDNLRLSKREKTMACLTTFKKDVRWERKNCLNFFNFHFCLAQLIMNHPRT